MVFVLKKAGVQHREGLELRTRYFDFGNLFSVPLTLLAQRALSNTELMEEIKRICSFTSLQPDTESSYKVEVAFNIC